MPPIILISGPSGVGQDSVIEGLKKKMRFNRVITTVTRPRREDEKQGQPYYFVTRKKFSELLKKNKFIEWAKVYDDMRGCTKSEITRLLKKRFPIMWKIDWQGVISIKKLYPQAFSVLLMPESFGILRKRIQRRGQDSLATIQRREAFSRTWIKHQDVFDFSIINKEGQLDITIEKVYSAIQKSGVKRSR